MRGIYFLRLYIGHSSRMPDAGYETAIRVGLCIIKVFLLPQSVRGDPDANEVNANPVKEYSSLRHYRPSVSKTPLLTCFIFMV